VRHAPARPHYDPRTRQVNENNPQRSLPPATDAALPAPESESIFSWRMHKENGTESLHPASQHSRRMLGLQTNPRCHSCAAAACADNRANAGRCGSAGSAAAMHSSLLDSALGRHRSGPAARRGAAIMHSSPFTSTGRHRSCQPRGGARPRMTDVVNGAAASASSADSTAAGPSATQRTGPRPCGGASCSSAARIVATPPAGERGSSLLVAARQRSAPKQKQNYDKPCTQDLRRAMQQRTGTN